MTVSPARRRTAGILAAVALGFAAPAAGAKPVDTGPGFVKGAPSDWPVTTVHVTESHPSGGSISDLGYVAIGSGVAALALVGVGGTRAAGRRRRRQRSAVRPTIAA